MSWIWSAGFDRALLSPSGKDLELAWECFELARGTAAPAHWMLELLYAEPRLESQLPDSVTRAVISSGPLPPFARVRPED